MRKVGKNNKTIASKLKFEKYTVENDAFDLRNFKEIRRKNIKLTKMYNEGTEEYPQFHELQQDVFSSLYKYNPSLVKDNLVDLQYKLNQKVMESVLQSPRYKELRLLTRMDKIHATIGTEVIGEEVKQLVEKLKEQFNEAINDATAAQKEVDEGEQGEDEGEMDSQEHLTLEQAKKALEKALQKVEKEVEKVEQRKVNNIVNKALNETQEASDLITNWGLEQDPNYERKSYQEKLKLLDKIRNSKKLKSIAQLAGRYKRLALTSRREKIKRGSEELYDTTYGDEIGKILPTETLRLLDPQLEILFKRDLLEKQLLQYKLLQP